MIDRIGFIGMGNMAQAIAWGFIASGAVKGDRIYAYAPHQDKLKLNAKRLGIFAAASLKELADSCDTLIMACKPYQIGGVLNELGDSLNGKVLLSIASGWSYEKYAALVKGARIQFIMPNTPAMAGEGIFLFEEEGSLTPEELEQVKALFAGMGQVMVLPGHLMGIGGTITGCGPAFMDMIMEAYADAAVKYGISRDMAYKMVAGTMAGAAKLQLSTGKHPGELKDAVCSPAGTTICGVAALEKAGLRSACIESVDAVMNKR